MFRQEIGFYLGHERTDGFSGFVDENNFFLAIEIETGMIPDQGRELTTFIREKIKTIKIDNLQHLDTFISNIIKEKNLPSGFSVSVGFLKENIFYLKTVNQGKVYIHRNNKLVLLIDQNKTASGYILEGDIFIFTFDKFIKLLRGEPELNKKLDHRPVSDIIDEITPELLGLDDGGTAALFLKLEKFEEDQKQANDFFEKPGNLIFPLNFREIYQRFGRQKTLTFITVFILGIILFWSVGLGYARRLGDNDRKKIVLTKELVSQKLGQAEQVSFLNMSSALNLIKDSKEEVKKLTPLRSSSFAGQLGELDTMILQVENKILKKEEKKYTEFFDLTVDDENAKGDKLYLNEGRLLVSDKARGILYELSLDKKSLDKDQSSEIKKSTLIALFEEKKYFYVTGAGVYQIVDAKTKKVIENDKEWGKIVDMAVFNGNIYLLDKEKNDIYKYMTAENGFGGKTSYFAPGQSIDLSSVSSFAIDGSVFLAGDMVMFRYTSGLRDGFKINLPDGSINTTKIFTSRDLEKIYAWEKSKGTIYVMGKNGDYQEQVNSKILSTASDFVVYKDSIFVLQGSKIFKIE